MTVLIAIPYFGVPAELIDKAARCALAQTHADTIVLIVGDGQRPPVSVVDDRLVVRTFPVNRGAPFTQQAMLLGSPFDYYAPHGADDWVEPDHLATLLRTRSRAAGSSVVWFHQGSKAELLRSRRTWIEFGLFSSTMLRSIGGYGAHEPCGQDSLFSSILLQTDRVALTTRPTYHKVFRSDSLTHAPATRQGSAVRLGVKARNRVVIQECERLGWRDRAAIRAYRESLVPPGIKTELEDRAAEVAKWLA